MQEIKSFPETSKNSEILKTVVSQFALQINKLISIW